MVTLANIHPNRTNYFYCKLILFLLFLTIMLSSCSKYIKEQDSNVITENAIAKPAKTESASLCRLPDFQFASFNPKIFSRLTLAQYNHIKGQISVSDLPEFNSYEHFFLSQSYECGTLRVQQLIYKDESCCTYLYYLTYSKIQKKYLSSKFVALNGSDANWIEKDTVFKVKNGIIRVKRTISNGVEKEEDGSILGYNKEFFTTELSISDRGQLVKREIDSSRVELPTH